MKVSLLDNSLWAASFAGNVILFSVLLFRGRWRQFPIFTAWMGYYVIENVVAYLILRFNPGLYTPIYWVMFVIDFLLQITLIFEIARVVLGPTGTLVQDARSKFFLWGLAGALIAAALTIAVHPMTLRSADAWGIRAFLFTSLLFCELFLAMRMWAQKLGLVPRNYVMSLGTGLIIWSLVSVGVDIAHSYFGSLHVSDFNALEHIRTASYIVAVGYWAVSFWLAEPERKPLSPEIQKYLVALHAKVQYDSSQVSGVQNLR
jgi:hypothetical protein